MAINLPQGLYTAGAVPIDTSGYSNFISQLAFKQQARQDALNEYYQNTNKDINPNGLRSQDTQGFLDKYTDFTNYYNQNRQAIQNPRLDGGQAQAEYNARHQDMLAYANMSKNSHAKHEQVAKIKENPASAYMLNTPDMIPALQAMEYPISDPRHKDIDIDQMQLNAQPLGVKDLTAMQAGLMKGMTMKTPTGTPQKDNLGNAWKEMGYAPEDKQVFLTRAQQYYYSDPKVRYHAERIINDPAQYAQASSAFLKATGRAPQNEAEIFAGQQYAMSNLDQTQSVKVTDQPLRSKLTGDRQAASQARGFNYNVALKNLGEQLTRGRSADLQQRDFETVSKFADDLTNPAFANKGIPAQDAQGKPVTEYAFGGPDALNKHYAEGGAVNGQQASGYRVERNKNYVRVLYPDGTDKIIPWKGFVEDLAAAAPVKKGGLQPATPPAAPPPRPAAPGAPGAKPTKSDQDLLKKYGITLQ